MIAITIHNSKWRLRIGGAEGETWEFPNLKTMLDELKTICEIKEKYGNIR